MSPVDPAYAYGPVPSRRLGKSLGINNIPVKVCTYSCVYCQVGRTTKKPIDRGVFYEPGAIYREVQQKVGKAREAGERMDYLAFVPDGEPTLDARLAEEITLVQSLGIPVGVITNSSLLWRADVREALKLADWVSLKVDAVRETTWRRINRPHPALKLSAILEGMLEFAGIFRGKLVSETMLVRGVNDHEDEAREMADFLGRLRPGTAYLSRPTRPPARQGVRGPDEAAFNRVYQVLAEKVPRLETLIGYEGDAFALTGDLEQDLLGITAVHPMRKEAVDRYLERAGETWAVVERLVAQGDLAETTYDGHRFYLRRFNEDHHTG